MEDRKFTDPEYFEHWSEDLWEGAPMDRIAVPSGWLYRDDIRSDTWRVVYVPDYWADHVVEYRERQKAKHGAKLKDDREDDLRAKATPARSKAKGAASTAEKAAAMEAGLRFRLVAARRGATPKQEAKAAAENARAVTAVAAAWQAAAREEYEREYKARVQREQAQKKAAETTQAAEAAARHANRLAEAAKMVDSSAGDAPPRGGD